MRETAAIRADIRRIETLPPRHRWVMRNVLGELRSEHLRAWTRERDQMDTNNKVTVHFDDNTGPWAVMRKERFSVSCWNEGGQTILTADRPHVRGGGNVSVQASDRDVMDGAEALGAVLGIELSSEEVQEAIVEVRRVLAARLLAELRVSEMTAAPETEAC